MVLRAYPTLATLRPSPFPSTPFPTNCLYSTHLKVPVKLDYSDLYNIMAYFDGGLGVEREGEHDDEAEKIAMEGKDWAERYWRGVDMQACTLAFYTVVESMMTDERYRSISTIVGICSSNGSKPNSRTRLIQLPLSSSNAVNARNRYFILILNQLDALKR